MMKQRSFTRQSFKSKRDFKSEREDFKKKRAGEAVSSYICLIQEPLLNAILVVPQAPPPVTMVNNFVDRFNLTEEPLLNAILDVPQAPLPLATVEHLNFASESGTRPKPRKGKLTKSDFSVLGPVDFRHIGHVGLDPETGVFEVSSA